VIDVVTANRRQRRSKMTSKITEETGTQEAKATGAKPKGKKKAPGSPRRAPVAPKKAKAEKTASLSKKAPKGATKAKGSRKGSKTAQILDLLKRPGGVSSKELMETTGWQPHSVRGFLSGTVGKKLGLTVVSTKGDNGERTYSIKV
jgi:hypothetical protein